jgi:hypothetical protein
MQRVAIDMDEVLVPLLKPMAQWHRRELPRKPKYPYCTETSLVSQKKNLSECFINFTGPKTFVSQAHPRISEGYGRI